MAETGAGARAIRPGRRVLVVDMDNAMATLLEEWLAEIGCAVETEPAPSPLAGPYALAIVDLPHARTGGDDCVRRVAEGHAGTPILALSGAILPGVHARGPVARALGVDCVLAKPVTRSALTDAVRQLLPR